MLFNWKDLITPIVTVTAVWLGAKLALSNDIRKKVLELETTKLERLAFECDSCVNNLHMNCMRIYKIIEDLSGEYTKRITLAEVTQCLKKSAEAGTVIDTKAGQQFQNTLELHRQADFEEWKILILPLLLHINKVLASPSLANDDCTKELSRLYWKPEQAKSYNEELAVLAGPLPSYRQQLFKRIADDYQALLHPAPLNIWVITRKTCHSIRDFVKYTPLASRNNMRQ
ncbi:TPA: hypothetical protein RFN03_004771 [Klebsiella aerogenes]|nr:hypothetical protein [Klebsiella aerogenes]HDU4054741.1 hypothetical protein [Klebsiella aerogenes]